VNDPKIFKKNNFNEHKSVLDSLHTTYWVCSKDCTRAIFWHMGDYLISNTSYH